MEDILDQLGIDTTDLPAGPGANWLRCAHTRLRMPDCCVLLTAELAGPAQLATFDDRLARVAADRGITVRNS